MHGVCLENQLLEQGSRGRRGGATVIGVNLSPGDFQEAVGELVEGQAPDPAIRLKVLHLIRLQSQRT